jgi:asparagine synthase (glutamine-hydrolysing)
MTHVIDRFEREGARASVELRHPYWTPRFMQFALSTPERLRCRGKVTKYIHVRAMQNLMSPAVLARRDKAEFSTVFHRHLKPLRHALTETIPHRRPGWLAEDGMARLYREYQEDSADGWRLWALWGVYASDTALPHSPE